MQQNTRQENQPPPQVGIGRWPLVVPGVAMVAAGTAVASAWLAVSRLTGALLPGPSDRRRAPVRRQAMLIWGRLLTRALKVRVVVEGTPPPPGTLLVSNHLSYLDILVYGSIVPVIFVAKAEVRRWPVWGILAAGGDTVFINRTAKRDILRVRSEMARALDRDDIVALFPEATSTPGDTIIPFRPPLLADAAANRTPVHWATISYATPPGEPSARNQVCWWGDLGLGQHLAGVMALKRVYCTVRFGDVPIVDGNRKALAAKLREAMLQRFVPSE